MYATTKKGTLMVCLAIAKGVALFGTLTGIEAGVDRALSGMSWMDVRSKADVRREAMALGRKCLMVDGNSLASYLSMNFDPIMMAFNRAYRRTWVRTKVGGVKSGMKLRRDMDDPMVFYLVSSHQKPQPAHKDLQGKILVDRFWGEAFDRVGKDKTTVASVIKSRGIRTVQWAMGAPHYLLSRPNCRHRLYALRTSYVLSHTEREIRQLEQPKVTHVKRPITDAQRWKDYLALRALIRENSAAVLYRPMKKGR